MNYGRGTMNYRRTCQTDAYPDSGSQGFHETHDVVAVFGLPDEDADPIVHVTGHEVDHHLPVVVADHPRHGYVRFLHQNVPH